MPFQIKHDARCGFRPAGTTKEFEQDFEPTERDFEPIVVQLNVRAIAAQLGVEDSAGMGSHTVFQRDYAGSCTKFITAQFPVRNGPGLVGLTSVAPGEVSNLTMEIENISQHHLGKEANRRAPNRCEPNPRGCNAQTFAAPSRRLQSALSPPSLARDSLRSRTPFAPVRWLSLHLVPLRLWVPCHPAAPPRTDAPPPTPSQLSR